MPQGLTIREREGPGIANLLVRKGQAAALASRLQERFGIGLPEGPRRAAAGPMAVLGTGPGAWLAISDEGGNAFAASLRDAVGDLASVVDQSDGLVIVALSGAKVRDLLCRLVAVDLDDRAFKVGDVAVTPAAHIGATLWRLDDLPAGSAVFELAVHRSFAASFTDHLLEAAAGA
jgi:sarcosine oxidase subunit gamma